MFTRVMHQVHCVYLFWCAYIARLESPIVGMEVHCISPVCGLVRSAEHPCYICNNPAVPSWLSPPLCLLFIFFFNVSLHTHTHIYKYIHIPSYVLNSEAKKGPRDGLIALLVRALSCLLSRARLKFTDRERFLLRPGVDS